MNEDIKLVQACRSGDVRAYEAIVSRYQALICAITYSAVGQRGISEELAQETFIQAWKKLDQLREPGKFRSWLCSIARSIVCNHIRAQKRSPVVYGEIEDLPADKREHPEEQLVRQEEEEMIRAALMRIPEEYREPLVLFYRQDHSTQQVAELMGLTDAAVRTRLHRGRQMLREEVESRIETTLRKTAPGAAFTRSVMGAVGVGLAAGITGTATAAGVTATTTGGGLAFTAAGSLLTAASVKIAVVAAAIVITTGVVIFSAREPSDPTPLPITNEPPVVSRETIAATPMNIVIEPKVKVDSNPVAFAPSRTGAPDPAPQLTEFVQSAIAPVLSDTPPVHHPDWPGLNEPVKYIYMETKLVSADGATGTQKFWARLPDAFRDEGLFDKITIDNGNERLVLDPNTMQAQLEPTRYTDGKMIWPYEQSLDEHQSVQMAKLFRDPNALPDYTVTPLTQNNDDQTIVYKVEDKDSKGIDVKAYVNRQTLLPEKIEAIVTGEPNQYGNMTGGTFIFDFSTIDDAVFSTDIPSDYQALPPKQPNTFTGQVVDLLGNPVPHAEVYLNNSMFWGKEPLKCKSNEKGEFTISRPHYERGFNDMVALWAVLPDEPGWVGWTLLIDPWTIERTLNPLGGTIPGSPGVIQASEDFFYEKTENGYSTRGVRCISASDIVLVLEPGIEVFGNVRDICDNPVPEAKVSIGIEGLADIYGWTSYRIPVTFQTQTAYDGEYVIYSLPRLWRKCRLAVSVQPKDESDLVQDSRGVQIEDPNQPMQADFILLYKGPTVRGIVVDNYGTPLPERYIDIRVNGKSFPGYLRKTDKDGRFEFSNCPADAGLQIRAELSHNSMAPHEQEKYLSYVYYPDTTVNVGYQPEQEEYEVKLVAIKPEIEIEALLVDSTGHPLPYFPVEIRADESISTQWKQDRRLHQRTDKNGVVKFINVPEMHGLRLTFFYVLNPWTDHSETKEMQQYFKQLEEDYKEFHWTEVAVPLVPGQMKYPMTITILTTGEFEQQKNSVPPAMTD